MAAISSALSRFPAAVERAWEATPPRPRYTATVMVDAVTPGQVAPPFDTTDATHGGANRVGTASRPVAGSQAGLGSRAGAAAADARPVVAVGAGGRGAAADRPEPGTSPAVASLVVSTGGAARCGRDADFFGRVGSITVKPLPPPAGLPAAAGSGPRVGRSASTSRMAAANPITYR
ncbi:MAG: hypothetical protein LC792_23260 [Actinobacteria bacterium]|nr:hypothetical protein [Actinomycetota bacterium]